MKRPLLKIVRYKKESNLDPQLNCNRDLHKLFRHHSLQVLRISKRSNLKHWKENCLLHLNINSHHLLVVDHLVFNRKLMEDNQREKDWELDLKEMLELILVIILKRLCKQVKIVNYQLNFHLVDIFLRKVL